MTELRRIQAGVYLSIELRADLLFLIRIQIVGCATSEKKAKTDKTEHGRSFQDIMFGICNLSNYRVTFTPIIREEPSDELADYTG